jgi:hypothetical protein
MTMTQLRLRWDSPCLTHPLALPRAYPPTHKAVPTHSFFPSGPHHHCTLHLSKQQLMSRGSDASGAPARFTSSPPSSRPRHLLPSSPSSSCPLPYCASTTPQCHRVVRRLPKLPVSDKRWLDDVLGPFASKMAARDTIIADTLAKSAALKATRLAGVVATLPPLSSDATTRVREIWEHDFEGSADPICTAFGMDIKVGREAWLIQGHVAADSGRARLAQRRDHQLLFCNDFRPLREKQRAAPRVVRASPQLSAFPE